ncbi:Lactonase, 7-bladed beta-propeller-domain-containing protein [Tuber borchii]|uniref:Lactonase, 7-bladed beta-propeller-domain-containing protein n=1 Tax=Tuber borchii TaxID=42251 RepID=A0A2T6ZA79_TUBBO|nr:Lactonase, 7-bladed beta-propeller-domain-containing protein [Tuber borchii]
MNLTKKQPPNRKNLHNRSILRTTLLMATRASAARTLIVGSGAGTITTYEFDETANSQGLIKELGATSGSAPAPTWQTIFGNLLYSIGSDKKLIKKGSAKGVAAPVSIAVGKGGKLVVSASYGSRGPGPVPDGQEGPPHQATMDPTGDDIIVPDLRADQVRVYNVNSSTAIKELESIKTPPGFGPRHAFFYPVSKAKATHLFVVGELSNNITPFKISYTEGQLKVENIATVSTFGKQAVPSGPPAPTAGEQPFLTTGNTSISPTASTKHKPTKPKTPSPPFSVASDAKPKFMQLSASGGLSTRQYSITKEGNWVAIANSGNSNFSIFRRHPENGTISSLPIISTGNDGASCAIWYEPNAGYC